MNDRIQAPPRPQTRPVVNSAQQNAVDLLTESVRLQRVAAAEMSLVKFWLILAAIMQTVAAAFAAATVALLSS